MKATLTISGGSPVEIHVGHLMVNRAYVVPGEKADLERWRTALADGDNPVFMVSLAGAIENQPTDDLREIFVDGLHPKMEIVLPGLGKMSGEFYVMAVEYVTEKTRVALESVGGDLEYTP